LPTSEIIDLQRIFVAHSVWLAHCFAVDRRVSNGIVMPSLATHRSVGGWSGPAAAAGIRALTHRSDRRPVAWCFGIAASRVSATGDSGESRRLSIVQVMPLVDDVPANASDLGLAAARNADQQ
jgi:hypothetical protein